MIAERKKKIVATIEARMTSSRLPGKVLMTAAGTPLLQVLVERLKRAKKIDEIVIATTVNAQDNPVEALAKKIGVACFRGSEEDVLGRVCGALRMAKADICVEITGDCPLLDPHIVDEAINEYIATQNIHPYVSNSDPGRSVPVGFDVQVFSAEALYKLSDQTTDPLDREHVSYGFYRPESNNRWNPRFISHASAKGTNHVWVTLDHKEDYEMIRQIHEDLSKSKPHYTVVDVVQWIKAHPALQEACLNIRKEKKASV